MAQIFASSKVACVLMLVISMNSAIAAPTCPEDYYWDTGVDECEHCRDICQNAQHQKTEEACQNSCPAYSKKLHDGAQKMIIKDDSSDNKGVPGASSQPSHDELSTMAKVGIGVAPFIVISGFVIAVIVWQRRIIQNRKKTRSQAPSPHVTSKLVGVQETHSGRQGQQEIALLGSSKGTVDEEEDENTLTKSVGPIYNPAGRHAGVLATPSFFSTRI